MKKLRILDLVEFNRKSDRSKLTHVTNFQKKKNDSEKEKNIVQDNVKENTSQTPQKENLPPNKFQRINIDPNDLPTPEETPVTTESTVENDTTGEQNLAKVLGNANLIINNGTTTKNIYGGSHDDNLLFVTKNRAFLMKNSYFLAVFA